MSDIREGTCPKCGSTEVYKSPKFGRNTTQYGAVIPLRGGFMAKYADVVHYVCVKCSYIESFVLNQQDLRDISREWEQVNTARPKKKNDEE